MGILPAFPERIVTMLHYLEQSSGEEGDLIQDLRSLSFVYEMVATDSLPIHERGLHDNGSTTGSRPIKLLDTLPNATSRNKSLTPFWGPSSCALWTPIEHGRETSTALFEKERNLFLSTTLVPSGHDASLQTCIGEQLFLHALIICVIASSEKVLQQVCDRVDLLASAGTAKLSRSLPRSLFCSLERP